MQYLGSTHHSRKRKEFVHFSWDVKMINAVLVFNNSGQPRLTKFYTQLVSQLFILIRQLSSIEGARTSYPAIVLILGIINRIQVSSSD